MNDFSLLNTRPLARRSPLPLSVLLHALLLTTLALWHDDSAVSGPHLAEARRRSVILLQFPNTPPVRRRAGGLSEGQQAVLQAARTGSVASAAGGSYRKSAERSVAALSDPGVRKEEFHRNFQLPADVPVVASRQTIVQLDVPPDLKLKQNIPLPNVVLWTPEPLPAFRKRFVAPPLKQAPKKIAQNLPGAPQLELPNNEQTIADMKLASVLAVRRTLIVPPGTTAPLRVRNPEVTSEPPRIAVPDPTNAQPAALISLVDSPIKPNGTIIVPPANQTSEPSGTAAFGHGSGSNSGNPNGSRGDATTSGNMAEASGTGGLGAGNSFGNVHGKAGAGDGTALAMAGIGAGGQGDGSGGAGSFGSGGAGDGSSGNGSGSSGNGGPGSGNGSAGSGSGSGLDAGLPGVTRIDLPKDGRFGVIVTGSSQSVPYPEVVGALTGKTVYTVYLNVGSRKKWILQYCLAPETLAAIPRGSSTALDAPWPFLIFRPDHLVDPSDYVIVHGRIDKEGRFDQLAMVFPAGFDQKDLLMNSLNIWAFRPATRDRVPTPVEVLLIIPGES
jgi:hypothetical protein